MTGWQHSIRARARRQRIVHGASGSRDLLHLDVEGGERGGGWLWLVARRIMASGDLRMQKC